MKVFKKSAISAAAGSLFLASGAFTMLAAPAFAQDAAPAAEAAQAAKNDPMSLDRVVVTGTAKGASKMKQSVSVSSMEADQISNSGAASAAEILRSVPGVHTENSGGEGNANVTVRGVPISAGGSRYVQFQEDGLPVLLFGDIAFGTPDQFLRADNNIDHLEVIRGGSASTLASNAPGGIINFISKTGDAAGGSVGLTLGVAGGAQRRLDFDYGGKLGAKTSFHIGGFNRVGEGDRPTGFNAASGGQIKGNITQQLDNGFIRLSFKALDDRTPTFLPVPVITDSNGNIHKAPGINPLTAFFISPSAGPDSVYNANGLTATNPHDGLHVVSNAIGAEAQFNLAGGWSVSDKFRKASNSGRFIGLFPANQVTPTSTSFTGTLFNTSINDLGNTVNDLKLSKSFGSDGNKATLTAGLFSSVQNVALSWFWNQYTVDQKNTGGNSTFLTSGWNTWGGCCTRNFDVQYTNTAPYAAISYDLGSLTLDGSVRQDEQKATGYATSGDNANQVWNNAASQRVNYKLDHTSYSLGANFAMNKDLALFARASDGVAFSADRLLYGNPLDGSVPVAVNEVKQMEAGAKWRSGGLNVFATLFNAKTAESNYEATTQKFTSADYDASGLELEAGYRAGDFRLTGGGTFTRSRITKSNSAAEVGKKPRRLSDVVFQVAPSMVLGDLEGGLNLVYNGEAWGNNINTIKLPAYTTVNLFLNYAVNDRTQVSLSVNNLTDAIGYTEVEDDGHAARSINGRTAKVSLKYNF